MELPELRNLLELALCTMVPKHGGPDCRCIYLYITAFATRRSAITDCTARRVWNVKRTSFLLGWGPLGPNLSWMDRQTDMPSVAYTCTALALSLRRAVKTKKTYRFVSLKSPPAAQFGDMPVPNPRCCINVRATKAVTTVLPNDVISKIQCGQLHTFRT